MISIRRVGAFAAALSVAGSLTLAGCGSQTGGGEGGRGGAGGESSPGSASAVRAYDINPVPRDRVRDGGLLRWGLNEYPTNWNLNHVDGNLAMVKKVIDALMPSAFRSDEKGEISANPDYLLEGKVTETKPKQVVRLKLNRSAKWSDGKPITWEDYRAQWQAMNGKNGDYRVAGVTGYKDIESVERGADDYEAVVTFAKPFGDWQSLFGPLYPKSTNATPNGFNSGWLNKIPVTAARSSSSRSTRRPRPSPSSGTTPGGATGPSWTRSSTGRWRATRWSAPSATASSTPSTSVRPRPTTPGPRAARVPSCGRRPGPTSGTSR